MKQLNAKACSVIDALGGTFAVALICKVRPASISGWKRHGIPDAREQFLRLRNPEVFRQFDNNNARRRQRKQASEVEGTKVQVGNNRKR